MRVKVFQGLIFAIIIILQLSCEDDKELIVEEESTFFFGADLSYVNQILDHGGVYREAGQVKDPYSIFSSHGTNLVRLRLWHNPVWTKEVYGLDGAQLYHDIMDVERAMVAAQAADMEVLLDFHFSDTWADPSNQKVPEAWREITELEVLKDSVYNYVYKTLKYLDGKGLMPAFVQIGNEINCGMLYTDAAPDFPTCSGCAGAWQSLGQVLNSAVKAVRDVAMEAGEEVRVILHVADPKNVEWFFDQLSTQAGVTDYDIIGVSYYPLWHTTVSPDQLSQSITQFRQRFNRDVIMLETAYPWTSSYNDSYANQFGDQTPITGFPFTPEGQRELMQKLTQEVKDGGGIGIVYWEPAWITSDMKDLWGTGSSWENNTFFDFEGNLTQSIDYMTYDYEE